MKKTIRRINFAFPRLFQVNLVILIIMMIFLLTSCNSSTSLSGREYVSDNLLLQIKMTFEKDQVIVESFGQSSTAKYSMDKNNTIVFEDSNGKTAGKYDPKEDTIEYLGFTYLRIK